MTKTNFRSKKGILTYLDSQFKLVGKLDKGLADRIKYTANAWSKEAKSVPMTELRALLDETLTLIEGNVEETPVTVEASLKKPDKAEPKTETPVVKAKEEAPKKPLAKGKKKTAKAKEKASVSVLEGSDKELSIQLAKQFTKTLVAGESKFEIAQDIKTMSDLSKAIEDDQVIVGAFYWTERHLKQFEYMSGKIESPKSFNNDLDIAQFIYVSDDEVIAYCVSIYAEGIYCPTDLTEDEGVRFCDGIEFQLYRQV